MNASELSLTPDAEAVAVVAAEIAQAGRLPTTLHELRAWRDRLHAILQLVTDAIVVVDFTGAVVYVNAPACAILRIEQPSEVIGRPLDALYAHRVVLTGDGTRVAPHDLPGKRAFDGESSQDVLLRFGDAASGDERVAIVRSAPIWDASRHVIALVQVFRDVTAEHRSRRRLELLSTASRAIATDAPAGIEDLLRLPTAQLADWCFLDVREDDGRFRRLAIACASPDDETIAGTLPRILTLDPSELEPRVGPIAPQELAVLLGDSRAALLGPRIRTRLTTAIHGRDRQIGALTMLACREAFDDADVAFAVGLARIAAAALEHARLYEAERSAAERLRFLGRATERLAGTIDYEATLRNIVDVTVPTLADCAVLEVGGDEAAPRRLVAAPEDPDAARVLENGASVSDAVAELETSSVLEIAITSRGSQLGTLTLIHGRSSREHGPEEAVLAREVATRAAAALEQARLYRAANEANRLKDEFLATVSHELRSPLHAIKGWAGILVRRPDPEMIAHGLAIIDRNARAQARLIDDLLDISRILSGKLKIDPASVDLVPLVREVIDSQRPAADAKQIALAIDDGSGVCATVGDRERLRQVVWNLVTNAIKFTDVGGRVALRLSCEDGAARMTVTDSGVGIAPPLLPYVFDRFRQGDGSTTRRHGGLGLGLAIVRQIVELHGGRVTAASDGPGKGAVFEVILPKCMPAEAPPSASSDPAHPSKDGARLEGIRILVVDDGEDARELLETLLTEAGARVTSAESAAEAMKALARARFDVLVSDIAMPNEDGYALIRRVRALPRDAGGAIAAVAVTAFARAQDRRRALSAGFTSWVTKPIHRDELVATIEGLASLARSAPRE